MKCKCGGELKRIAIDCYQCVLCGLKQTIMFASLPIEPIEIKPDINVNINANVDYMKKIEESILKALMIPKYLRHK